MLCELKTTVIVPGLVPADPLDRIVHMASVPQARPANDDTAFRPCLLERRRRRIVRRSGH